MGLFSKLKQDPTIHFGGLKFQRQQIKVEVCNFFLTKTAHCCFYCGDENQTKMRLGTVDQIIEIDNI